VVHSTWPSWTMWHLHAPTFNKWHKKKKKKTLHILTHGVMQGCGLTSLVVCINDKIRDVRERNVTIRSETWTTNIRSLGFHDIRERVTLWRLILRSLVCKMKVDLNEKVWYTKFVSLYWGRRIKEAVYIYDQLWDVTLSVSYKINIWLHPHAKLEQQQHC
jgi:hypothetical protein